MVRFAWPGWLLAMLVGVGPPVAAQTTPDPTPGVELKENYPNPFYPSTTIPFEIHPTVCGGGHQPVVTLKVYNVLAQVVALPGLVGESEIPLNNRRLRCGEYRAFWDGKTITDQEVSPGVYWYRLTVDGRSYTMKMSVQRRLTSSQ